MTPLQEAIRGAGIQWRKKTFPEDRANAWKDGIMVDLDEDDALEMIEARVLQVMDPILRRVLDGDTPGGAS